MTGACITYFLIVIDEVRPLEVINQAVKLQLPQAHYVMEVPHVQDLVRQRVRSDAICAEGKAHTDTACMDSVMKVVYPRHCMRPAYDDVASTSSERAVKGESEDEHHDKGDEKAAHRGTIDARCTISKGNAVAIFLAQRSKSTRDGLATRLAKEHGISLKAVYDIWNMRTWCRATRPHWTAAQEKKFMGLKCAMPKRNPVRHAAPSAEVWKRTDKNTGGLLEEALTWIENMI